MTDNAPSDYSISRPGTLVRVRGREWVVLPSDPSDELLMLRPLGGLDEEITGVLPKIEKVESANFPHPTLKDLGDFSSGQLLRDAARLSTRSAAGPFRSFARIEVEPRPYQLVPLMMALKLDPVRMLIADDVGIGKTIEACLIARELLDRGEISSLAVLCPPHLAEQWQQELIDKFNIAAELVLSSKIRQLESGLSLSESIFTKYPFTVISTDFIKRAERVGDFENNCPDLVIVDEAHGCTLAEGIGRGRQQRHRLVSKISQDKTRHLLLVTATPHSGNEEAFHSLIGLLDESYTKLSLDLNSSEREKVQGHLAKHFIQRRRSDVQEYLNNKTPFPERSDKEIHYKLHPDYYKILENILDFAHEYVTDPRSGQRQRRVRYWSALGLLRCVSSSPAAAIATLKKRIVVDGEIDSTADIDQIGRRTILDQEGYEDTATVDFSPGSEAQDISNITKQKLQKFIKQLGNIRPKDDHKLQGAIKEIKELLKTGFHPIVFCRFIDTSKYVAQHLSDALGNGVRVESVTGELPPVEREERIRQLTELGGDYVLVCTDCLSEGINLQENFDSALHYDLAWNPTRHEQREGRVDRFGQPKSKVQVITYFGSDNPIDGVILDVLIRKHKSIKSTLGVIVSVPDTSEQIIETLFEGALFREKTRRAGSQLSLSFIDDLEPKKKEIHAKWDKASKKELGSRFAQKSLSPNAVAVELDNVRNAIGNAKDVKRFITSTFNKINIPFEDKSNILKVDISKETPRGVRQAIGHDNAFEGRFEFPISGKEIYLGRASPTVEGLASWVLDQALNFSDNEISSIIARCGAIRSHIVRTRTTLLISRFRFHIRTSKSSDKILLCEEILPMALTELSPNKLNWLTAEKSQKLLEAKPEGNLPHSAIEQHVNRLLDDIPIIVDSLKGVAFKRAEIQLKAHNRVRKSVRVPTTILEVEPVLPADIIGAFVVLPQIPSLGNVS